MDNFFSTFDIIKGSVLIIIWAFLELCVAYKIIINRKLTNWQKAKYILLCLITLPFGVIFYYIKNKQLLKERI